MTADEYQKLAARTLIDAPEVPFTNGELTIMLAALELGARVGAALDYVKKSICHRHGFKMHELSRRLVDVSEAIMPLMNSDITEAPHYDLSGNDQMLIWCALGLGGEAGEVMDVISALSVMPIDRIALSKELGDSDWYNAALCTLIGVPMSDVMQQNIAKLKKRYEAGYSSAASAARVDVV